MMMGVVSLFLVCWLPYHTYFITANVFPAINYTHYIQVIIIIIMIIIPYHTYFTNANVFPAINYTHYLQVDPLPNITTNINYNQLAF